MMRAAVLTGGGGVTLTRCAPPDPGPGQVRVRLEGTGVCGSNLPVWEGRPWFEYPRPPGSPGHEGWGVVDATGPEVDGALTGARVAVLSERAFADLDLADVSALVPVPDALAGRPCPAEPLGCAVNVMRRAAVRTGEVVAVLGVGFLGAALVALAARAGARVVAASRRPFARELAGRLGAVRVCALDGPALVREVGALTGGGLADCVIEAVGSQQALDVAGELARVRGRIVIAGYHQDGPRQVNLQLWNWRGLDVINAHERDRAVYVEGMRQALRLAADGTIPLDQLITHALPLEELDQAFRLMTSRPSGFLKAVVVC